MVGEQLDRWLRRWEESELDRWLFRWQDSGMAGGNVTLEDWMRSNYPDLWEEYQRRSRR